MAEVTIHHEMPEFVKLGRKDEIEIKEIPSSTFIFRAFPSQVIEDLCSECGLCISLCPHGAVKKSDIKPLVNEIVCKGCGICVGSCPKNAIMAHDFTTEHLMNQVKGYMGAMDSKGVETKSPPRNCNLCPIVPEELPELEDTKGVHIRLTCTGRFEPALAIDALAKGYSAVLVVGCLYEGFPFEKNRLAIKKRLEFSGRIMELLGLDPGSFVIHLTDLMEGDFKEYLRRLSKVRNGVKYNKETRAVEKSFEALLWETNVHYCLDCGKCTGSCPVASVKTGFSPRRIVEMASMEPENGTIYELSLWNCLTCHKCSNFCPEEVLFPEFVREQRKRAIKHGNLPVMNHGGITNAIANAMANLDIKQNRLGWVEDAKVSDNGEILLFTGCIPHFDIIFDPLEIEGGKNILYNAVKIMNHAGIIPAVMADEVCCGHDQLWAGEEETFKRLVAKNLKAIEKTGAKRIVTICPEGAMTLKRDYAVYGGVELDVVHITEFIAELLRDGKIELRQTSEKVTYQDPCRLSRYLGVLDEPREVIKAVNPEGLVEMEESRELSTCCGTTLFRGCDSFSEAIRDGRLKQADATGAECMITACPKCQIHFKCTLSGKCEERGVNPNLKVKNIVTYVAENMK